MTVDNNDEQDEQLVTETLAELYACIFMSRLREFVPSAECWESMGNTIRESQVGKSYLVGRVRIEIDPTEAFGENGENAENGENGEDECLLLVVGDFIMRKEEDGWQNSVRWYTDVSQRVNDFDENVMSETLDIFAAEMR